jgi:hypothetical protein
MCGLDILSANNLMHVLNSKRTCIIIASSARINKEDERASFESKAAD